MKKNDFLKGDIWQTKDTKKCGVSVAINGKLKSCALRMSTETDDIEIHSFDNLEFFKIKASWSD